MAFYRRKRTRAEPSRAQLLALWEDLDAYACTYCGAPYEETDHYVPLALGGAHAVTNLVPACTDCNHAKGAQEPGVFLASRGVHLGNFLGDIAKP